MGAERASILKIFLFENRLLALALNSLAGLPGDLGLRPRSRRGDRIGVMVSKGPA
ncbi:MAG: hypothetical protein PHN90_10130 [Methanothrix sp.]|nr:hypothetical protein [Methanothrix sp.]